jgi:hypothetical protein
MQQSTSPQVSASSFIRLAGTCVVAFAVAAPASTSAQGRMYSCKDDKGRIVTSDSAGTCHGKETRVIGPDGRTVQVIAAPLTMEQRKAKQEEEERKAAAERTGREQKRKDAALLDTYRDEADIEVKRKRALEQIQAEVKASEGRSGQLKKIGQELADEAEFYKKKKMPAELQRKIDESNGAIAAENRTLQAKQAEVASTNLKFDEDKKRFVELTKGQPNPAAAASTTASNSAPAAPTGVSTTTGPSGASKAGAPASNAAPKK